MFQQNYTSFLGVWTKRSNVEPFLSTILDICIFHLIWNKPCRQSYHRPYIGVVRKLHANRKTEKKKKEDLLRESNARSLGGAVQLYHKLVCILPKFDLYSCIQRNFHLLFVIICMIKINFYMILCLVFKER